MACRCRARDALGGLAKGWLTRDGWRRTYSGLRQLGTGMAAAECSQSLCGAASGANNLPASGGPVPILGNARIARDTLLVGPGVHQEDTEKYCDLKYTAAEDLFTCEGWRSRKPEFGALVFQWPSQQEGPCWFWSVAFYFPFWNLHRCAAFNGTCQRIATFVGETPRLTLAAPSAQVDQQPGQAHHRARGFPGAARVGAPALQRRERDPRAQHRAQPHHPRAAGNGSSKRGFGSKNLLVSR